MTEEDLKLVYHKLDKLQATLDRMEQRQIKTTKLVEEVEKAEEQQVVGSFGSIDHGDEQK